MNEEKIQIHKNRHGCLTAYLVFMMIMNSGAALLYLFGADLVLQGMPNMPEWSFPVLIIMSIFNLVCAVSLFRWKKWGFWGFLASGIIVIIVNLSIGLSTASALGGIVGIAILYGVLQIGKENKGWPQLD
jgi:uncharacterized membrane protein YfhO